jgi:hypothetical protein
VSHENYWEVDESIPDMDADHLFPCACGNGGCVGHDEDEDNINVGGTWYAADCPVGRVRQAFAFGEDLEAASKADVARDDDFEQVRR